MNLIIGAVILALVVAMIGWWIDNATIEVIGWLAVFLLGIAVVIYPQPAHADFFPTKPTVVKESGTVVVNSHVGSSRASYLLASVKRVDRYTNTTIAYGPCRSTTRCITVRIGNVPGAETGRSSGTYFRTTITVEPTVSRNYLNYLFTHEFGHAFGLAHSGYCVSVMSPYLTCHDRPTTTAFTPAQRATLARH